jgi:LPXTG-motif cell wall-anchored protein
VATTRRTQAVTGRAFIKSVAVAALAALAVCPAAAAHGGGGALGFRSKVTRITPAALGVSVTVLDYDDRLELHNESGKPLVVLGYEGEPYLAFRDGRVYRNVHSPATYLNDDRFGNVALPAAADPKAQPAWEEVSPHETFDWHDHRIHWMSTTLPPKVRAAKDEPHHVFDWTVPAELAGKPVTISGSLDYEPPSSGNPTILLVLLGIVIVGGAALLWFRRASRT